LRKKLLLRKLQKTVRFLLFEAYDLESGENFVSLLALDMELVTDVTNALAWARTEISGLRLEPCGNLRDQTRVSA